MFGESGVPNTTNASNAQGLIPEGRFIRQVKDVVGEGENACLEIGWKPSTAVFASVRSCRGYRPKDPIGKHVEFEFDKNSQPSAPSVLWFRFV